MFNSQSLENVCRNHFTDDDIINNVSWYDTKRGVRVTVPLTQTRVKENAVPSLFDNLFPIDPISKRIIRNRKPKKINKRTLTRVVFPPKLSNVKEEVDDLIRTLILGEESDSPKKMNLRKMLGLFNDGDATTRRNSDSVKDSVGGSIKQERACPLVNNQEMNATTAANILLELNVPSGVSDTNKDNTDDIIDQMNDDNPLSSSEDNVSDGSDDDDDDDDDITTTETSKADTVMPKVISKNGKVPTNVTVKIFNVLQQIIISNCDYQPVSISEKVSTSKINKDLSIRSETNVVVYESRNKTKSTEIIERTDAKRPASSRSNPVLIPINEFTGSKDHTSGDLLSEHTLSLNSDSNGLENSQQKDSKEDDFDATNMLLYVTKDVIANICDIYNKFDNYEMIKVNTENVGIKHDAPLLQITKKLNFYISFVDKNKFDSSTNVCTCVISSSPISEHSILCTYKSNRPFRKKPNVREKCMASDDQKLMRGAQTMKQNRSLSKCGKEKAKSKTDEIESKPSIVNSDSKYNLRHRKIDFKRLIGMTDKNDSTQDDDLSGRRMNSTVSTNNICRKVKTATNVKLYKKHKASYDNLTINAENRVYIETDGYDEDDYDILKYHKLMNKNLLDNSNNQRDRNSLVLDKEIRIILKKCDSANYAAPKTPTECKRISDMEDNNDIFGDANETADVSDQSGYDEVEETIENIKLFVTENCLDHTSRHSDENEMDSTNDSIVDSKENILDEISGIMYNITEEDNKMNIITNIKTDNSERDIVNLSRSGHDEDDISSPTDDVVKCIFIREIHNESFMNVEDDPKCVNETDAVDGLVHVEDLKYVIAEKNLDINEVADESLTESLQEKPTSLDVAQKALSVENQDIISSSDKVRQNEIFEQDSTVIGDNKSEDGTKVKIDLILSNNDTGGDSFKTTMLNSDIFKEATNEDKQNNTVSDDKNLTGSDTVEHVSLNSENKDKINCQNYSEKMKHVLVSLKNNDNFSNNDKIDCQNDSEVKKQISVNLETNDNFSSNDEIDSQNGSEVMKQTSVNLETNDNLSSNDKIDCQNGSEVMTQISVDLESNDKVDCQSDLRKIKVEDQPVTVNCNNKLVETMKKQMVLSIDPMVVVDEMNEQVFHEVTITSDGNVAQVVKYKTDGEREVVNKCDGNDNVLHEFITINNRAKDDGKQDEVVNNAVITTADVEVVNEVPVDDSYVGNYDDVIIIKKEVEGLVDDDSDYDNEDHGDDLRYVGDTNDVVVVQGYVDDIMEEDIDDEMENDDVNDELIMSDKVIYCTYNETDNIMERVSENLGDVEYILKLDDADGTTMDDSVLMKGECNDEVLKDMDDGINEAEHFQKWDRLDGVGKLLSTYRCNICLKEINRDSMRRHLKRHTGVKFCPHCSKSYCDIVKYNEHISLHKGNEGKEKYMCYICRKKFCFLKNIYKHLRNAHPNDTKNDTIILLPDNGNNNRNNIFVNKEKKIKKRMKNCPVCNRLVTNFYYRRHLQSHSGERPFACPVCDKRFYEKSTLKNHLRTHTGERPYKCEHCWKSFGHVSTLAKHSNIHTGAKKFQCDICNKSVSSSYNLKLHHRIHTGEKPFTCNCCDRNFTSKAGLDKHVASSHAT